VPITKEKESGLWQTPTVIGIKERSSEALERKMKKRKEIGRSTVPPGSLMEQIQLSPNRNQSPKWNMWRTPDAHCDRGPSSKERMKMKLNKGMPISLNDQVKHPDLMWPTPRANTIVNKKERLSPKGRLSKDGKQRFGLNLQDAVTLWPTPRAAIGMTMKLTENIAKLRHKRNLESEVAYQEHKAEAPGKGGGTLNPTWVEWLMGYPLGHTDLKD
jgi:DNA (cytosine-5)-methyltransferase 1